MKYCEIYELHQLAQLTLALIPPNYPLFSHFLLTFALYVGDATSQFAERLESCAAAVALVVAVLLLLLSECVVVVVADEVVNADGVAVVIVVVVVVLLATSLVCSLCV